jgi:hypothetical protein
MIHALHRNQVDRYFSGALGRSQLDVLLDRLWTCASCRDRYERQLVLERALPDGDRQREERSWRSIVMAAGRSPREATTRQTRPSRARAAILISAVSLAIVVLVPLHLRTSARHDPVARGASGEQTTPALHLYRSALGKPQPLDGEMRASDGILVAYSNPSTDLNYLMVFAVDQMGGVHWYYPAYEHAGEDPVSVSIRPRAFGAELGEEIRHQLPDGDLKIFAFFLPHPQHVLEVESMIGRELSRQRSVRDLTFPDVPEREQVSFLVRVRP